MDRVELATIKMLQQMGMPPHLKGYQYIKTAAQVIYNHPGKSLPLITKEVYPVVAEQFNTKSERVERGIRHAIEQTGKEEICNFLHIKSGWLTNSSFLAAMAEAIRVELATERTEKQLANTYTYAPEINIEGDTLILK